VKRDTPEARKMLGRWDLGGKRSLNQLIAFTGVDTRKTKIDFDNCGKLQWVPFEEGEDDDWYVEDRREAQAKVEREVGKVRALASMRGERVSEEGGKEGGRAKGSSTRRKARGGRMDERLAIPDGGGAGFVSALCLLAFVAVIYTCVNASDVLLSPKAKSEKGGREGGGRAGGGVGAGLLADFRGMGKVVKMV